MTVKGIRALAAVLGLSADATSAVTMTYVDGNECAGEGGFSDRMIFNGETLTLRRSSSSSP